MVEGAGGLARRGVGTRAPSVSASRCHLPAGGEELRSVKGDKYELVGKDQVPGC
jgi:hypothetical protein